jgi:site-specific DNA-cytosine methylase
LPPVGPDGIRRSWLNGIHITTKQDCNSWQEHWYEVAARICGMDDGFSAGVDGIGDIPKAATKGKAHRLEAIGNAIVPQIAYQIFDAINQYHK